ncbi:MAG: DNA repair protein RecO [candidate division Zixibacteria bacterium HGW-Zixibacteria-1]|nr:MAG: DNA repair protein RecO [candidate division Zixibacteria bacterium HGW-Zixibacteria-1]
MPQVKSEGIILKSVNWKENSKIHTIFTDNAGRQSLIDKGGRSLKSKRGRLMTFTRMELGYFKSEKSEVCYVTEVDPIESFEFRLDGTLGRLTFASAALELLYDLLPADEPQEGLYHLTIQYLRLIDRIAKTAVIPVFIAFFLKLLSYLGYRPNFAGCNSCGKDKKSTLTINSNNGSYYNFSPERGGLVCSTCQMAGEYYIKLQSERLDKIYSLQTASLAESAGIGLRLDEAEEFLELLTAFVRFQTDIRELNSLKFLEKLKKTSLRNI